MKQSAFIKALKFASHAMAIKDIRYYLNGVCLELMGDSMILIGTDGHRMAWAELADDNSGGFLPDGLGHKGHGPQFIIPADSVKIMLTMFKDNSTGSIAMEFDGEYILFAGAAGKMPVHCVQGTFPDWRRVCKRDANPSGAAQIGVNADYLAAASKACGALCDSKYKGMKLAFHGASEAMLVRPDTLPTGITEAACVVMPMRL